MTCRILFFVVANTISMTTEAKARLSAVIPSLLLLSVLAIFIAIAFAPPARTAGAATTSGTDPDAVRALNNCTAYTASHDFETQLSGTIKAKVFGIPYKISVSGGRVISDGDAVSTAESVSAFVKAGIKRKVSDGKLYSYDGTYKRKNFSYSNPKEYSYNEYVAKFGKPELGLVKYELNGNILSAVKLSDNSFRYTLEPKRAAKYCSNEVKTTLDVNKSPVYDLIEVTLDTDGKRPSRVTIHEIFTVDKFGGTRCDAVYTETFSFKN